MNSNEFFANKKSEDHTLSLSYVHQYIRELNDEMNLENERMNLRGLDQSLSFHVNTELDQEATRTLIKLLVRRGSI